MVFHPSFWSAPLTLLAMHYTHCVCMSGNLARVPADWTNGLLWHCTRWKSQKQNVATTDITLLFVPGKALHTFYWAIFNPCLTRYGALNNQRSHLVGLPSMPFWLCISLQIFTGSLSVHPMWHVDIKAAFNSVDRTALWKALCSREASQTTSSIQLTEALHQIWTVTLVLPHQQWHPWAISGCPTPHRSYQYPSLRSPSAIGADVCCRHLDTACSRHTATRRLSREMSTADPRCPVVWLHQERRDRSTHRSPPHHGPQS